MGGGGGLCRRGLTKASVPLNIKEQNTETVINAFWPLLGRHKPISQKSSKRIDSYTHFRLAKSPCLISGQCEPYRKMYRGKKNIFSNRDLFCIPPLPWNTWKSRLIKSTSLIKALRIKPLLINRISLCERLLIKAQIMQSSLSRDPEPNFPWLKLPVLTNISTFQLTKC